MAKRQHILFDPSCIAYLLVCKWVTVRLKVVAGLLYRALLTNRIIRDVFWWERKLIPLSLTSDTILSTKELSTSVVTGKMHSFTGKVTQGTLLDNDHTAHLIRAAKQNVDPLKISQPIVVEKLRKCTSFASSIHYAKYSNNVACCA